MTAPGLSAAETRRQIELLRSPPPPMRLVRCGTVGDGIRVIAAHERSALEAAWREAAALGRFSKFVPASGAASRMFSLLGEMGDAPPSLSELERRRDGGDAAARDLLEVLLGVEDLPFFDELVAAAAQRGLDFVEPAGADRCAALLATLIDPAGLDYSNRAKGLIPFHRYPDGVRTALEEHLVEGAAYILDRQGRARLHFTVGASQLAAFESAAAGCRFADGLDISFSTQHPSTDTLALEADGSAARTAEGDLLLRPGGHGALLGNLQSWSGDLVYIKNIDNVLPQSRQAEVATWQRLLGGLLVSLEQRALDLRRRLRQSAGDAEATAVAILEAGEFCSAELGRALNASGTTARLSELEGLLDRPLRVCGMVPSAGEPGGGPFWVRDSSGVDSLQIVESAQVDLDDSGQRAVWEASTHFNPVMLVGSLRRHDGSQHRLSDYVDPQAVFVSQKPFEGRALRVLEHPGLWNGAMAGWNTVFVEVPLSTFAPVKTVLDLLRPAHQGA